MTRLALAAALALATCVSPALSADEGATGEWQLLALNGAIFPATATLTIDDTGAFIGKAPCNRWFATNTATLPALALSGIGATRMACDALADETLFLQAIGLAQTAAIEFSDRLILRGPDDLVMEFTRPFDDAAAVPDCKTCTTP